MSNIIAIRNRSHQEGLNIGSTVTDQEDIDPMIDELITSGCHKE